jgi:hypothetical protein
MSEKNSKTSHTMDTHIIDIMQDMVRKGITEKDIGIIIIAISRSTIDQSMATSIIRDGITIAQPHINTIATLIMEVDGIQGLTVITSG